jgi:hypothetical protein
LVGNLFDKQRLVFCPLALGFFILNAQGGPVLNAGLNVYGVGGCDIFIFEFLCDDRFRGNFARRVSGLVLRRLKALANSPLRKPALALSRSLRG